MELAEDLVLLKCNLITCVYEGAMVRVLALVLFLLLSGHFSLSRLFFVHNNGKVIYSTRNKIFAPQCQ